MDFYFFERNMDDISFISIRKTKRGLCNLNFKKRVLIVFGFGFGFDLIGIDFKK